MEQKLDICKHYTIHNLKWKKNSICNTEDGKNIQAATSIKGNENLLSKPSQTLYLRTHLIMTSSQTELTQSEKQQQWSMVQHLASSKESNLSEYWPGKTTQPLKSQHLLEPLTPLLSLSCVYLSLLTHSPLLSYHAQNLFPIWQAQLLHPWDCWCLAEQQRFCCEAAQSEALETSDKCSPYL